MGKQYNQIKADLRKILKGEGRYSAAMEPLISIAAANALLHKKVIDDIEELSSPVVRDNEDLDFIPAPDEAVTLLPKVSKNYHNSLVALGLADGIIDDTPKVGRPPKDIPAVNDSDEVQRLMSKTLGKDE